MVGTPRTYNYRMEKGNTTMQVTLHIAAIFVPAAELSLHSSCC
jgi:hypothetical protein